METSISNRCRPGLRLLDDGQIRRIHHTVLRVLDEVGVRIDHSGAVDLLADHGARVQADNVVQIPPFLVEDAITSAPANLVIYNREKQSVMELGGSRIYFGTGTDLPKTIDLKTRKIRDTNAEDIVAGTIISDAMPHIDFIGSYGLPKDVPAGLHYIRCFQLEIENSKKPVFFTAESQKDLEVIWEMACAVAGSSEELSR